METGSVLVLIAGMAAVTYASRLPLAFLVARRPRLPRLLERCLEQVPVAAYAAIVVPGVLQPGGRADVSFSNLYVYAALASAAAVAVTRNLFAALAAGVGVAILLGYLVGS